MVQYATDIDRTLQAVADPARREILERLARGPASVSELAGPLEMSLPGVMKHVRILEGVGLVETHKRGRTRECRLGPARLENVQRWIEDYRRQWERRLDRLEVFLRNQQEAARDTTD
ncbi:MAG: ArsR/SmtB family transcription factor [Dehalococcoidia bacterium]